MKMFALIILTSITLLPLSAFCGNYPEDKMPKHELSFAYQIPTYNSICASYSFKISESNSLKFGLNMGSHYYDYVPISNTVYPNKEFSISPAITFGFEHHKLLKSNFEFISGANLRLNTNFLYSKVENPTWPLNLQTTTTWRFGYGLEAIFGLYYKISDNFLIGSAFNPNISYNEIRNGNSDAKMLNFDLTNIMLIDLRYRF